jgi:hypothetical protein
MGGPGISRRPMGTKKTSAGKVVAGKVVATKGRKK